MSVPRNKICAARTEAGEADCVSVHLQCNQQQNWQWTEWAGTSPNIARRFTVTEGSTNRLCPYEERYFKPEALRDCLDAYTNGFHTSGVYSITPDGSTEVAVYCDQQLQGGGWTVFQRRDSADVAFSTTWAHYWAGFGDVAGNHWLGNNQLHLLTEGHDQQVLIVLGSRDGLSASVRYSEFWVGNEAEKYELHVRLMEGATPGAESATYAGDAMVLHDGMKFSTPDTDNDDWADGSCAVDWRGGWWYKICLNAQLNGDYVSTDRGLIWYPWKGLTHSMLYTAMMVRGQNAEESYRDCVDAYNKGRTTSGVYTIRPNGNSTIKVYCEQELDGGGWEVFQRRQDGSWDFYRGWRDYNAGFGDLEGEFWLGNDKIHLLTKNQEQKLKVRLGREDGVWATADYSTFYVEDASQKYRLHIGGYSGGGVPGEAMMTNSNNQMFSTYDQDNVNSCAAQYEGAWCYRSCYNAHLNGHYRHSVALKKINWHVFGGGKFIDYTAMMVKKN